VLVLVVREVVVRNLEQSLTTIPPVELVLASHELAENLEEFKT
ncbi:unnamed protein product, partial [marine sediment metagenome]